MRVVVVGTGYVGLVSGTCFAEMGNRVTCVDTDAQKIEKLCQGEIPIYEPGLKEMVHEHFQTGELKFTTSLKEALPDAEVVFIAVGTPMGDNGSADLRYVLGVAREIGECMSGDLIIVDKSTVPVGTSDKVRSTVQSALQMRADHGDNSALDFHFDVVSNPEFLKEGSAITDFMKPDRVVIGADLDSSRKIMEKLYSPFFLRGNNVLFMDVRSAEMTKYAANAMLASRISFMNEISNLCESTGANINSVRLGIGSDSRIGSAFLFAGCGYGGSCFPKDVQALVQMMIENGIKPYLLEGVEKVNEEQKNVLWKKVVRRFGEDLTSRTFAIWGLAFKPNTDDMREAPSITVIKELIRRGAKIQAFDPEAVRQARECYLKDLPIEYCKDKYAALDGADALLLITEWTIFRSPDIAEMQQRLKYPVIFDGRNLFLRFELEKSGFEYYPIGIPQVIVSDQNGQDPHQ